MRALAHIRQFGLGQAAPLAGAHRAMLVPIYPAGTKALVMAYGAERNVATLTAT